MAMHLKEELEKRGLLYQFSDEAVFDLYEKGGQALYYGVDPTADSMHLGNFVGIMKAVNYMKKGNKLYLIVGGATGMIGDPGGKDAERNFLDESTLAANVQALSTQMEELLQHLRALSGIDFEFEVINNMDFYRDMSFIDFLRKVGKHITVNSMMKKETVRKRIEEPDKSISFTEFSYMLIQGRDFVRLFEDHGVKLQICGSDQRGNSVTGLELIRKLHHEKGQAYVASGPLLLDSTGKKFGKSEGNAIWLDRKKNSPFFVYQYFMNTADADVEKYLKALTLLPFDTIKNIVDGHQNDPSKRLGQKSLAFYVTATLFGEKAAFEAEKITEILFAHKDQRMELVRDLKPNELEALFEETGGFINLDKSRHATELAVKAGLGESNGEIKKMIKQGALYINEVQVTDLAHEVSDGDYVNGILLMRKGKKHFKVVKAG